MCREWVSAQRGKGEKLGCFTRALVGGTASWLVGMEGRGQCRSRGFETRGLLECANLVTESMRKVNIVVMGDRRAECVLWGRAIQTSSKPWDREEAWSMDPSPGWTRLNRLRFKMRISNAWVWACKAVAAWVSGACILSLPWLSNFQRKPFPMDRIKPNLTPGKWH